VNAAGWMQIEDDVDRLAIMQIKPLRLQAAERVSTLRRRAALRGGVRGPAQLTR
jgi:hypothetical protein